MKKSIVRSTLPLMRAVTINFVETPISRFFRISIIQKSRLLYIAIMINIFFLYSTIHSSLILKQHGRPTNWQSGWLSDSQTDQPTVLSFWLEWLLSFSFPLLIVLSGRSDRLDRSSRWICRRPRGRRKWAEQLSVLFNCSLFYLFCHRAKWSTLSKPT